MIFYKNTKENKIVLNVESTGCNSLDELIKKGWELIGVEKGRKFYKLDAHEADGYYAWPLTEYFDDFLEGAKNGTCFLSEDNVKKALKYLRKLALKDLWQVGENVEKEEK